MNTEIMILNEEVKNIISDKFDIDKIKLNNSLTISNKFKENLEGNIKKFYDYIVSLSTCNELQEFYEMTDISIGMEVYSDKYKMIMDRIGSYPDEGYELLPEFTGGYIDNLEEEKVDIIVFKEDEEATGISFI